MPTALTLSMPAALAGALLAAQPAAEPVVFRFSLGILALPVLGAALFVVLGLVAPNVRLLSRFRGRFFLFGALALLFAGMMTLDRIVATSEDIRYLGGAQCATFAQGFRYDEVESVRIVRKPKGRKGRMTTIWELHRPGGGYEDFDPSDLWNLHSDEIVALLREHGVRVEER